MTRTPIPLRSLSNQGNAARIERSWARMQRRRQRLDWTPAIGWACVVLAGAGLWWLL